MLLCVRGGCGCGTWRARTASVIPYRHPSQTAVYCGGAENAGQPGHENAGHEIDGPIYRNLHGMKLQDLKMTDQCAGHEIAGHEIGGPICKA